MEPLLIERADETEQLRRARRAVVTGHGAFVYIVGEAGIGKTSLLQLVADDLAEHDVTVLAVRADETDRRRPSGVVRRLLPDLAATDDAIDASLAALERCAATGPVALLVDDVHWADEVSLDVIRAIARRATDLGVLLVCAGWPQASSAHARLEELAISDQTCIRPQPLDADGLTALVERMHGVPPGPRLTEALDGTAGNPFLASELLSAWSTESQLIVGDDQVDLTEAPPLPDELSRRLAVRALGAVPDAELLLRSVAAAPGGARAEELAVLLDRPLGDVVRTVLAAIEAGVLIDHGEALIFRHDLLRRAVAEETPRSVMRSLGRGFADVLVDQQADPDRIAACLIGNADRDDPLDPDRLVEIARRFRPTHPAAAADLLRLALDDLDGAHERAGDLTVELGWALIAAGRSSDVPPLLAERLGPHRDDEPTEVHRLRGIATSLSGHLDLVAERYADLDATNLGTHFDVDDAEVVDAFAEFGLLRVSTGQLAQAAEIVEWVERSPTPASPFRIATVETVRAFLGATSGHLEAAGDHAQAALDAIAADLTDRTSTATPTLVLAMALDLLGRSDDALDVARRGSRHVTPRWGPPLLQFFTTLVMYRRGDWDDALAEVDASLIAADEAQLAMAVFWPSSVATLISCARDRSGRAHEWLGRSQKLGGQPALGREWMAYAAAAVAEADGDSSAALDLTELVILGVSGAGAPAMFMNGGPELIRRSLAAGRHDLAATVVDALTTVTGRTASPVAAAVAEWSVALVERDAPAIEAAADELAAIGRIPEAARALAHAAVLAGPQDPGEAKRIAKRAFALAEELDAELWRRQLIAELRTVGVDVRPRRRRRRASTGWTSLTASEESVVALVGEGLTNTEIAERLIVSRRTVESHLSRVYAKVGLSTRPQLVAAVARRHNEV